MDVTPEKSISSVVLFEHMMRSKTRDYLNLFKNGKDLLSSLERAPFYDFMASPQENARESMYKQSIARGKEALSLINKNGASRHVDLDRLKAITTRRAMVRSS